MKALPQAVAAAQARINALALVRALRDIEPPVPNWDTEREAQAATPGRPGVLCDYRRRHEWHYDFTPLKNGVPCGPSFHVYPTCRSLNDAAWEAVQCAYRVCGRDVKRYPQDADPGGLFERKHVGD
jgi:hypothetical protein